MWYFPLSSCKTGDFYLLFGNIGTKGVLQYSFWGAYLSLPVALGAYPTAPRQISNAPTASICVDSPGLFSYAALWVSRGVHSIVTYEPRNMLGS
ncbi:hypothetical protein Moror_5143 [Moniliophthora roreri MCA 2997]|uniref:Uncharacterized protein n=1 Tax=Moniliophthora roreri (strain MCA 2997) TaxID=1381753 RepID=V2WQZ0_MONRO|nr:hypothetical protein Moror_5143 [Moniliophthora roreri MCA 2997]